MNAHNLIAKSSRDLRGSGWLMVAIGAGFALLTAPGAGAVAQGNAAASGSAATVNAQWQSYDLRFHYFGFTTYYSCSGLEDRLEQILMEMGADRDVHVSASGCFGFGDFNNMLSARIKVRMPATDGVSPAASFPVVSKAVMVQGGQSGHMGSGDCELLEQVRDQLLPALKLQLVKDNLVCVPGQGVRRPVLQVMALIAQTPEKR